MLTITQSAQEFLSGLLEQQDEPGLGLRLNVLAAGTPQADCELEFCPPEGVTKSDITVEFVGFNVIIEADSAGWLENAKIDYETQVAGGQLNIKAPGIKGSQPAEDASLVEQIQWILDTDINPALAAHRGHVSLVEVTDEHAVVLQFGGGCHGCGMVDVTLKEGIEKKLKQQLPEITAIIDATDHSSGTDPYFQ